MKSPTVTLRMRDGECQIIATPAKEIKLDDRAMQLMVAAIKGLRLRPSRLDRDLALLRECNAIEENGKSFFSETKDFLSHLDKIEFEAMERQRR